MSAAFRVRSTILFARLCTGAVLFSGFAPACECVALPKEKARQYAEAIFRGRVVHIAHLEFSFSDGKVKIETLPNPPPVNDHTLITFEVMRYWKGPVAREVKVFATARPWMCDGYRFEMGKTYILYTRRMVPATPELENRAGGGALYEVPDCPGRIVQKDIQREARWLGRGKAPE